VSDPLDAKVRSGPSQIHGTGCFAIGALPAGGFIGTFTGPPALRDGTHVLWALGDDGAWAGRRGTCVLRYLNHSDRPNAEFTGFDLYALRPIAPGAEITIDYQP